MGNATDKHFESDKYAVEEAKQPANNYANGHHQNGHPQQQQQQAPQTQQQQGAVGPNGYLSDPTEDKDETDDNNNNISIYQSQYAMNLYGVTDSGEFVKNAEMRIPKTHKVDRIKQLFKYKKKLGEGASGKVLLVEERSNQKRKYALKELHRKHKVNAQLFLREVVILESLKHPNILELHGIYLDKYSYYIATAYYSGGEFFDRIIKIKKFSEKQALKYIKPILSAIHFMHSKAIVHRDLKPSNMVFDKKGKNGEIKIIDFGTSEIVIDDDLYTAERVGTILYAPPEWKKDRIGEHIKKGDLWSLGVIVYVLMVGRLPFGEWKHIESYNNDLWFPKKLKRKLSFHCIDFILKLLERYPDKRLSAKQALSHAWIGEEAAQNDEDLGAELKHGLQSVRQEDKISRVVGRVVTGKIGVEDVDNEDRKIVFDGVKNQQDVQKYLKMYQDMYGDGATPQGPTPMIPQTLPFMHNAMGQINNTMKPPNTGYGSSSYHPSPPLNVSSSETGIYNIYRANMANHQQMSNNHMNPSYPPQHPPIKPLPPWAQQQQQQQLNNNMNPGVGGGGGSSSLPSRHGQQNSSQNLLFEKNLKFIYESINEFREQDKYAPSHQQTNGGPRDDSYAGGYHGASQFNEELDEDEYQEKLSLTLSRIDHILNDEQEEVELRDMLGPDYDELKIDIDTVKNIEKQSQQQYQDGNLRQIAHKNKGNPLNINCSDDEELDFNQQIVTQLMNIGLDNVTKNACIRAVLATDSRGVEEAAAWLMDHMADHNINKDVEVV